MIIERWVLAAVNLSVDKECLHFLTAVLVENNPEKNIIGEISGLVEKLLRNITVALTEQQNELTV